MPSADQHEPIPITIEPVAGRFAICRLDPGAPIPGWVSEERSNFLCITQTSDELSIVCAQTSVPRDVRAVRDFIAMRVAGVQDFDLVGILARLSRALADADVAVFAISTFETDYLFVRERDGDRARVALAEVATVI